jgi:hypothetical protein
VNDAGFMFYDAELSSKVQAVYLAWSTLLDSDYYHTQGKHSVWRRDNGPENVEREAQAWERAQKACRDLDFRNRELWDYVAREYLQIDQRELLKESFRIWRESEAETSTE